ncbi:hypothetical protein [Bacillus badius]|nr:hypothetical protein [Bacillus badius]KIL74351.1 hypothetical protein SD78_1420 [Bacillus badius]
MNKDAKSKKSDEFQTIGMLVEQFNIPSRVAIQLIKNGFKKGKE